MGFFVFTSQKRSVLQDQVNAWLLKHNLTLDQIKFQYHAVYLDDPSMHIIEHTLVIFYERGERGESE